jgi:hypothetical protein
MGSLYVSSLYVAYALVEYQVPLFFESPFLFNFCAHPTKENMWRLFGAPWLVHKAVQLQVDEGVCFVRVSLCMYVIEGCRAGENHPLGHSAVALLTISQQARTKKEGFSEKFSDLRELHQYMLPRAWQK